MQKNIRNILAVLINVVLFGCMLGPDFYSPDLPDVDNYTEAPPPLKTVSSSTEDGASQYLLTGQQIPALWWMLFHSEELNRMIQKGFENNPNIQAAQAALRQAQENVRVEIGNTLFPAIDAQAFAQREKLNDSSFGEPGSSTFNLLNTQFNFSYMIDFFGKNRRSIEALCALVDYQRYELEATYLSLASNITITAITEASLREQIKATHDLIQMETKVLNIIQKQFHLGAIGKAAVLAEDSQLAQIKATLPPLEKNLAFARHLLSVLIGELPSEKCLPTFFLSELSLPTEIPLSLPSLLVRQRPDVMASEALLHQANALIGVATANLFPQVTITGYYGWESTQLSTLFSSANNIWSISSNFLQPVFHGGALLAARRSSIAAYEQAYAQYRQTVLVAFQNVADALRALEIDATALKAQVDAEKAALDLLHLTEKQLKLGAVNYLTLLYAQRQYELALINKIQAQSTRLTDTVALFQALGGGWWGADVNAAL